jgi:hypothetical protein
MQLQTEVREAVESLLALRPKTETIESFLEKVVVEAVSRNHSFSERSAAMRRALMRGIVARTELEGAEGGSCSSEELAERLAITRQAVDVRRKERRLVAWRDAQGHWRFPVWQLDQKSGRPLKGLEPSLAALPEDEWSWMLFFLSPNAELADRARPLDLLRAGRAAPVLAAAQRYGRHGE